jgi:hypothetical protein
MCFPTSECTPRATERIAYLTLELCSHRSQKEGFGADDRLAHGNTSATAFGFDANQCCRAQLSVEWLSFVEHWATGGANSLNTRKAQTRAASAARSVDSNAAPCRRLPPSSEGNHQQAYVTSIHPFSSATKIAQRRFLQLTGSTAALLAFLRRAWPFSQTPSTIPRFGRHCAESTRSVSPSPIPCRRR